MPTLADNLARLRVAISTGRLPPDLGRWLAEVVPDLEPVAERLEARNDLLRQAAGLLSGSRWAKAGRLEREILALTASPRLAERGAGDGVRELVSRALAVDPGLPPPASRRQLLRILGE